MTDQPPEMVPSAEERIMRAYHLDAYGAPIWSALFAACATAYRDGYAAGIKAADDAEVAAFQRGIIRQRIKSPTSSPAGLSRSNQGISVGSDAPCAHY